jgi:hypothetical protein
MNRKIRSNGIKLITIILLLLFLIPHILFASSQNKKNKWSLYASTGLAIFSREFSKEFVFLEKEFSHNPGIAFDIHIGHTLGKRWEPAIKFTLFNLSGEAGLPEFSANGYHTAFKGTLYAMPVEYKTVSSSFTGIIRFYFREIPGKNIQNIRIDPFIEVGAGSNYFTSKVYYKTIPPGQTSAIIFQKGIGNQIPPTNVIQANLGMGTKIGNPSTWHMVLTYNADIVNYACLDAVHNYTDGIRNHAKGIVSRFMAGIVIPLGGINSVKYSGSGTNEHLPWSP